MEKPTSMVFMTIAFCFVCAENKELNTYIQHYEPLTYAVDRVHNSHNRVKRSNNPDAELSLTFQALGRNFHLRLKRDTSVFSKNLELEFHDGSRVKHDPAYIYEGYLRGDSKSKVFGSIIKGTFAGVIHTTNGTYHVEKYEYYFKENPAAFHSLIYRDEDVITDSSRLKRDVHVGSCGGVDPNIQDWMSRVQNSAIETTVEKRDVHGSNEFSYHKNMYTGNANRQKREVDTQSSSNKRTCSLLLQADPYMWKYFTDPESGLGYDDSRATEEITSLFGIHVRGVKSIYKETRFQHNTYDFSGFSFVVRRLKIIKYDEACVNTVTPNKFCPEHIDVTNFLNINSLMNHNEYCLAYAFTYRDFTGGTLGLAWVGSAGKGSGGVCEKHKGFREENREISKSLNTGIVTLLNYNARVPPKVSTITFAHEIGHNFGSPHDSGSDCTPFTSSQNREGNYIMFASATTGERPNNSKFSPCSIGNMTLVLDAVINEKNDKANCFIDSEEAFCGNNIVEANETCDCGFEEDCSDICCYGRPEDTSRPIVPGAEMCRLRPNARCSPSKGPCCQDTCLFQPNTKQCIGEQECTNPQNCDGNMAECPEPPHKPNNTLCNENTQICLGGECQGTICSLVGQNWTQCYLTAPEGESDYDKGRLCYLSCLNPITQLCVSSSSTDGSLEEEENIAFKTFLEDNPDLDTSGIQLPPGAPCDNFQGYCDVFQKCRGANADGPLARLKNLLFSEETLTTIREWIVVYWWAVLLMGIGLVVIMGVFIHVCSVHTPSSNPQKKPARKISFNPRRNQGPPPGYPNANNSRANAYRHQQSGGASNNHPPAYEQYDMKHSGGAHKHGKV